MLLLLFILPSLAFAQKRDIGYFDVTQPGYVAGARIDTVKAAYAQAEYTFGAQMAAGMAKKYTFRWNQLNTRDSEKDYRLVDAQGEVIAFPSVAAALNFFHLNGWELIQLYQNGSMLFKRR